MQAQLCHNKDKLQKNVFVDNLTLLEKISLSKLENKTKIIGPLNWHDRFNLNYTSDKCILQHTLHIQFTKKHFAVLNSKKN